MCLWNRASRVSIFVAQPAFHERKPAANDNFACAIGINSLTIAQLFSLPPPPPVGSLHAFCGCLVNLSRLRCSLSSCLCTSDTDSMRNALGTAGERVGGEAFRFATRKRKSVENRVSEFVRVNFDDS